MKDTLRGQSGGSKVGVHRAAGLFKSLSCLPRAETSPSPCFCFWPPGRQPHLLCLPFSSQPPSPSGPCSAPWPVSWGLWVGRIRRWKWHSKGAEHTRRTDSNGRLVVPWGPGWQVIKAGNAYGHCTRALRGWILHVPTVAETSCHLPLEEEQAGPGWGTPLLALISHCGACPGPLGGEQHPSSCGGASASQGSACSPRRGPMQAPPPRRVQAAVPEDTAGQYGRVGWGKP